MEGAIIPILLVLIALVVIALGRRSLRNDDATGRGARPGTGDHVLSSQYQSGLGGHDTTWRVPRDPQEYAKRFVPNGHIKEQEK